MRRVIIGIALLSALILPFTACEKDHAGSTVSVDSVAVGSPRGTTTAEKNDQIVPTPDTTPGEGSYETIPQEQAKAEMDALKAEGKSFILLDVRRADEYAESHIEGALLLPNEEIGTERPDELSDLTAPIYVYCRSGNRSLQAAKKLAAMGYTVYDFGGIIDWQYGTVKGE